MKLKYKLIETLLDDTFFLHKSEYYPSLISDQCSWSFYHKKEDLSLIEERSLNPNHIKVKLIVKCELIIYGFANNCRKTNNVIYREASLLKIREMFFKGKSL